MKFIKVNSTKPVVDYLVETLSKHLAQGEKVLWLLSGGSSIPIEVEVSKILTAPIDNLTVGLVDERFGKSGHGGSNFKQLSEAGFALSINPVLKDQPAEKTTKDYAAFLEEAFKTSTFKLGLVGIGPDGHVAGIKPHSPAVAAKGFACQYDWDDFHRITMTPKAIESLDEVVSYLRGQPKWHVINELKQNLRPAQQPAQILKHVNKFTVYNDYKGDKK